MSEKLTAREVEIITSSADNGWRALDVSGASAYLATLSREFDDQAQFLSKMSDDELWRLTQWDDSRRHSHTVCFPNHEQSFILDLREALAVADRWRDEEREPCDCDGPIWR